jgi:CheY-like chemotaxis protein
MKILLVEDDSNSVDAFSNSVRVFEKKNNLNIETVVATNKSEALEKLDRDFDGAIIDLKLGENAAGGNDVIEAIHGSYRIPIAVHTGTPSELVHEELVYIGLYVRGQYGYEKILDDLLSVYSTGLTKILGGKGIFEEALDKVFWNHLPHVIPDWKESTFENDVKEKQLLRYTLAHIQELLSLRDDGNIDERCSAEVYIFPPIRNSVSEGFIVKSRKNGFLSVVLTPACDISRNRAEFIQLAGTKPLLEEETILNKKSADKRRSAIRNFVGNSKGERFHFLPSFKDIPPSIIDFQDFNSVLKDEFENDYECICSITTPFFKDIVSRFSAYYSRQGSPDFHVDGLTDEIVKSFQEIKPI